MGKYGIRLFFILSALAFAAGCGEPLPENTETGPVSVAVTGVSIDKESITLRPGSQETLSATVTPADATNTALSWTSDKPSVASVSENGTVIAIAVGTATVTAATSDGTCSARCAVTVDETGPEIGAFVQGGSITTTRYSYGACISGGYAYIVGGYNGEALTSVEYAPVSADGTYGSFSAATALPEGRYGHKVFTRGGYLYAAAGYAGTAPSGTVIRAPIQADGSLGAWTSAGAQLNTPRTGFGLALYGDTLYLLGGSDDSYSLGSVEYAAIAADGTIGAFTEIGNGLNTPRMNNSAVAYGGYLYVAGGRQSGSRSLDSVEWSRIQPDGSPGAFAVADEGMILPRKIFEISAHGGYLYAVCGLSRTADDEYLDSIEYAPLDSETGEPGAFAYATVRAPNALSHVAVQTYGNRLHILNGYIWGKAYSAPFID